MGDEFYSDNLSILVVSGDNSEHVLSIPIRSRILKKDDNWSTFTDFCEQGEENLVAAFALSEIDMSPSKKRVWSLLFAPAIVWTNVFAVTYVTLIHTNLANHIVAILISLVNCYAVHRLAIRLESKGQLRYLKSSPSSSALKSVANELDRMIRPSVEHRTKAERNPVHLEEHDGE